MALAKLVADKYAELLHAATVGGDKGFDVPSFVAGVRALDITPHVAQKVKGSAIDERTTRVFFLFYFDALKIPLSPFKIPRWLMTPVLQIANRLLIKPLLRQDGFAVEAEQAGYENHFDAPMIEINPVIALFQQLTIRKWEEYLAKSGNSALQDETAQPVALDSSRQPC